MSICKDNNRYYSQWDATYVCICVVNLSKDLFCITCMIPASLSIFIRLSDWNIKFIATECMEDWFLQKTHLKIKIFFNSHPHVIPKLFFFRETQNKIFSRSSRCSFPLNDSRKGLNFSCNGIGYEIREYFHSLWKYMSYERHEGERRWQNNSVLFWLIFCFNFVVLVLLDHQICLCSNSFLSI